MPVTHAPKYALRPPVFTEELGVIRPSGEPFSRPATDIDGASTIGVIDEVVAATAAPELTVTRTTEPCVGFTALTPNIRLVAEAMPKQWEEAKVRNARILGRAALFLSGQGEIPRDEAKKSLSSLFRAAHEGDKTAANVLETDAASGIAEMVCKSGARMTAAADIVDGKVTQYGRTTEERQFNTRTTFAHKIAGIDEMSKAEGQNALALEQAIAAGTFKKGDVMVECSLVPAAQHEDLRGSGLFLREVVAIIRVTKLSGKNRLVMESYLVCGTDQDKLPPISQVKTKAEEEAVERLALENRFDIKAFRKLFAKLGVNDAEYMSPSDMLSVPLFVAGKGGREAMDGLDIAMAYDETVAELTGRRVMMGSTGLYDKTAAGNRLLTPADYRAHFDKMDKLQGDLLPLGDRVGRECAKRWQEVVGADFEAGRLMHKLSERAVVNYLATRLAAEVSDPETYAHIELPDMSVMGVRAYHHLMEFQANLLRDDLGAAEKSLIRAEKEAEGTGCPLIDKLLKPSGVAEDEGKDDLDDDDDLGPRVFKCTEGHINVRPKGLLLKRCRVTSCKRDSVGCA